VRRLRILVSLIVFLDTAFFAVITPLLPSYVDEFGLSKSGAGLLTGAYAAGTMLGALPAGWFAARAGVKPAVLTGLVLVAASSVAFAFAPSILWLDVARFAQGIGSAATWAGALGWLAAEARPEERGEILGGAFGFALFGALFGPVLGGAADLTQPEWVFSAVGALAVVLAWIAWRMPPKPPQPVTSVRAMVAGLRETRIAAGAWIVLLVGLMFGAISVLAPLRLDELGAAAWVIAGTFLLSAALEAVVSPVIGRLSDRVGPLVPARWGLAGATVAMALLPWPGTSAVLIGLLILSAPVIGILWLPGLTLLSRGAERRHLEQAVAFAVMNLAWSIGETGGSAGGARLADAAGDAVPYLLLAAASAASLTALVRAGRVAGRVTG
jgi:MFS family permease